MATNVRIPTPLRKYTAGREQVLVDGSNLREILEALEEECSGIKEKICDEVGNVRRFVNVFVNDEDVRHLDGLDTNVEGEDTITIIPAIAGGGAT